MTERAELEQQVQQLQAIEQEMARRKSVPDDMPGSANSPAVVGPKLPAEPAPEKGILGKAGDWINDNTQWTQRVGKEIWNNPRAAAISALGVLPLQDTTQAALAGGEAVVDKIKDPKKKLLENYLNERKRQIERQDWASKQLPTANTPIQLGAAFATPMGEGGLAAQALKWGGVAASDSMARGEGLGIPALAGGLTAGIVGAPKLAGKIGKKLLTGMTGLAPETMEQYLRRPNEVLAKVREMPQIAHDAYEKFLGLKKAISEGSARSYEVLRNADGKLDANDVAAIADVGKKVLSDLGTGKAEQGIGATAQAGYRQVEKIVKDFEEAAGKKLHPESKSELYPPMSAFLNPPPKPMQLPYDAAKKALQDIDNVDAIYKRDPSQFSKDSILALKEFRNAIRKTLGEKVPEFNNVMGPVAADTQLLREARPVVGNLNMVQKRLERLSKPKSTEFDNIAALNRFGDRTGTNFAQETSDRLLLDKFNKDMTRGSRNVNLYGALGGALLGGDQGNRHDAMFPGIAAGALVGSQIDKMGGPIAKGILDLMKTRGFGFFGKFANPLIQAAKNGNRALAAEHLRLMNSEPEYKQLILRMGEK